MRKLLISFLLATTTAAVATPALAQRADREDTAEEREERRKERTEARKERVESRQNARSERIDARQDARSERVEQRQNARQQNVDARTQARDRRASNVNERGRPTLDQRQQQRSAVVQQRQERRDDLREQRQESRDRYIQEANQRRLTPPAGARPDRPAPPPPTATNHRAPTWSTTHWRRDGRYDWRRHRDRNRSHFRLGIYFDPFGWNYRRYNIGWRLWPSYYSNRYWLNDPWSYRLPYAPWPYRWIRYYDDAILVNTMTGQVVDVIYDFFW